MENFLLRTVGAWDGMVNAPQRSAVTWVEEETGTHFWNNGESTCAAAKHLSWPVVPAEHGAVSFAP